MCITSVKCRPIALNFYFQVQFLGTFQYTVNLFYLKGLTILDYNKIIFKGYLHSKFTAQRVTKFEVTTSRNHVFVNGLKDGIKIYTQIGLNW